MAREFAISYMEAILPTGILPAPEDERRTLLELFVLEKALYEVQAELIGRSEKVIIPIRGILRMMATSPPGAAGGIG